MRCFLIFSSITVLILFISQCYSYSHYGDLYRRNSENYPDLFDEDSSVANPEEVESSLLFRKLIAPLSEEDSNEDDQQRDTRMYQCFINSHCRTYHYCSNHQCINCQSRGRRGGNFLSEMSEEEEMFQRKRRDCEGPCFDDENCRQCGGKLCDPCNGKCYHPVHKH